MSDWSPPPTINQWVVPDPPARVFDEIAFDNIAFDVSIFNWPNRSPLGAWSDSE